MADEEEREELEREREELARKREELERERKDKRGKQTEDRSTTSSLVPKIELNMPKSGGLWFFILLIIAIIVYVIFKFGVGSTLKLVIIALLLAIIIIRGLISGTKNEDSAALFIALAFIIWIIDMLPETVPVIGPLLGPPFAGYVFHFSTVLQTNWAAVITGGLMFIFLFFGVTQDLHKRKPSGLIVGALALLFINVLVKTYYGETLNILSFQYFNYILIGILIIGGFLAFYFREKLNDTDYADWPSYLFMALVFSYLWVNDSWKSNPKAWIHIVYIFLFGYAFIRPREEDNPTFWHIAVAFLLIADFYGYSLIVDHTPEFMMFIPMLALIVSSYCSNKSKSSYPFLALFFIFILMFVFWLPTQSVSAEGIPQDARKGISITEAWSNFIKSIQGVAERRLEFATGGLYRSQIEKNQYEPLGVFFSNIRAAQPKFYTDEPVTIWATVSSRTLSDPVKVEFGCNRWQNNERVKLDSRDSIEPKAPFSVSTYEEKDAECKFGNFKMEAGTNLVTLSLKYNFETDAYQKIYLIDKERLRSMTRENLDPFDEFKITDKKPAAIYTNGPVEIAVDITNLIAVPGQQDTSNFIKPTIGIKLNNRDAIADKSGNPIGQWEGRIKDITELVVVTPPGITIDPSSCNPIGFNPYDLNACGNSCTGICTQNTESTSELSDCNKRCNDQCDSLFKAETGDQIYKGYQLDISQIINNDEYKDFDRYRIFSCRLNIDRSVLEDVPITTKFIRIKARYNYSIEKSFNVLVEQTPGIIARQSNDIIDKYALAAGIHPALIKAIAYVESSAQHCNDGSNICSQDKVKVTTTPRGGMSIGIMQINVNVGGRQNWKTDASEVCGRSSDGTPRTVYNFTCNIKLGVKILSDYYDQYKGGISAPVLDNCLGCCHKDKPNYYSQYLAYRGIAAALRAYNGWGCGEGADTGYVEKIVKVLQDMETNLITTEVNGRLQHIDTGLKE